MRGASRPPGRRAGDPFDGAASGTTRYTEVANLDGEAVMAAQADLRYLVRRLAILGVICEEHKNDRMAWLVGVSQDGLAYIDRSPGIKSAYGALMHARVGYRHDADLEETTWTAVVQAGQRLVAALQDLPEADARALRGLPGECLYCRRRLSGRL